MYVWNHKKWSCSILSHSLWPWTIAYQAPPSMEFSRLSTGVGCHFLLQRIFLTLGSNLGLLNCRQMLYHLSQQGSPSETIVTQNYVTQTVSWQAYFILWDAYVHGQGLQPCQTLCNSGLKPGRLLCPWDSPDKNTGVGFHAFLQGIVLTQGSNLCLLCHLHWQAGSLPIMPPTRKTLLQSMGSQRDRNHSATFTYSHWKTKQSDKKKKSEQPLKTL